jgi:hypothetical protein
LCLGKSDFEALSNFREKEFFAGALSIGVVPPGETLRQGMNERAEVFLPLVSEASVACLENAQVPCRPLKAAHVPLDGDVTPFDNSQTRKEGGSRTSKGYDGYAPMAGYLGQESWCLGFELRHGKQHCENGTPAFLETVLEPARRLAEQPILLRLDGVAMMRPKTSMWCWVTMSRAGSVRRWIS